MLASGPRTPLRRGEVKSVKTKWHDGNRRHVWDFSIFRISRLGASSLKRAIVIINSSKCMSKTELPKLWFSDVFYTRGGPWSARELVRIVQYIQYYITSPVDIPQNVSASESLFASVDILGDFTRGVVCVTAWVQLLIAAEIAELVVIQRSLTARVALYIYYTSQETHTSVHITVSCLYWYLAIR